MTTNTTRFYKPVLAKLTDKELMFAGKSLDAIYKYGVRTDVPDLDFAAPDSQHKIMTRRIAMQYKNRPEDFEPEYFDMGPFQIMYNFPSAERNNKFPGGTYGAPGWSYRMLYEFLSEAYNAGIPYIDTYFEKIFKSRPAHREFLDIYNTIQDRINNEQFDLFQEIPLKADGTPDVRYAASKKFMDFKVWQDPIIKQGCKDVASKIREDIVRCLYSGIIPMSGRASPTVSKNTQKYRAALQGMRHPNRLFFASGELIRHLNVFVVIGKGADKQGRAA
jgi:hypothetical protein